MRLRHGVFLAPFHFVEENPTLGMERDLQLMELLDELGYNEAWIGEHHSGGLETIDSPELFIAAAAERTRHIRFGTGVISLPYHNPLNVANRIIQLDHMTRGRVMMGVGPGLLAADALMLGVEPETTRDRMAQSLDVILRLFRGEVVTEKTDWYNLREARTHLNPYQDPYPEVCVASAVTPSGGRLAGKYDLGMLCVAAGEHSGFNALDTNWAIANEIAAEHGNTMDPKRLRIVLNMHIAETRERARENLRFGAKPMVEYINNNMERFTIPDGVDAADFLIDNEIVMAGTPDDAIARIEKVREKQGEFGAVLMLTPEWADWAETKRSYELYAQYVIPYFNDANKNRRSSYAWNASIYDEAMEKRSNAAQRMFAQHQADREAKGIEVENFPPVEAQTASAVIR